MVNKMISVVINTIFPLTYLEKYLMHCSYFDFVQRLTPRLQYKERQFSPFYYKDTLVKDCIIELKERNNVYAARLFSQVLVQYILQNVENIKNKNPGAIFYVVPTPQHISKTKEKGFLHTETLCKEIIIQFKKRSKFKLILFPCIEKVLNTKRLHDLHGKKNRFKTIKNTMKAYITKVDASNGYFFLVDDVFTTGATFKEMRRTLKESGAFPENLYFISIAH